MMNVFFQEGCTEHKPQVGTTFRGKPGDLEAKFSMS